MHFSPCGWFCFEEPNNWVAEDSPGSIMLYPTAGAGSLEVTSARKESHIQEDEILETHENLVLEGFLPRKETSVKLAPCGANYIRTLCSNDSRVEIYIHIFWTHYCIFIEANTPLDSHISKYLDALDELVQSIQMLTTD